jgi:hypothetical protein
VTGEARCEPLEVESKKIFVRTPPLGGVGTIRTVWGSYGAAGEVRCQPTVCTLNLKNSSYGRHHLEAVGPFRRLA